MLNKSSKLDFTKTKDLSRRTLNSSSKNLDNIDTDRTFKSKGVTESNEFENYVDSLDHQSVDSNPLIQDYKLTASYTNRTLKQK
jgi:hypothetical protein